MKRTGTIIRDAWIPALERLGEIDKGKAFDLFISLLRFGCSDEVTIFDDPTQSALYAMFIPELAEDKKKYAERCKTNSENGKKGGAPKGNQNAKTTENNRLVDIQAKQANKRKGKEIKINRFNNFNQRDNTDVLKQLESKYGIGGAE